MKNTSSRNEPNPRQILPPPPVSNVFNNSFKNPLNLYESNIHGRKVSRPIGAPRQAPDKPTLFQSESGTNKSVDKQPKVKKLDMLISKKPQPLNSRVPPERVLKPEVALISKYNSKQSANQQKIGSTTQMSSQMMSPSLNDRFEYTNDSLQKDLPFVNKGVPSGKIFEDSGKTYQPAKKREQVDSVKKHYFSEKEREFGQESAELRSKLVLKRNASIVKVQGSPDKSAKNMPASSS